MAETFEIKDIEERVILVGVSEQDGDDAEDSLGLGEGFGGAAGGGHDDQVIAAAVEGRGVDECDKFANNNG